MTMLERARPGRPPPCALVLVRVHLQLMDVAQFVMQSGQLASPTSPWVLKYFVEYFTPFTGLLPLVRAPAQLEC